jgi:hypothetical protein
LHLLRIETDFVSLEIYFVVANVFSMDFVLLWFHSYESSFCYVGDIYVIYLLLSYCKLRLTLVCRISMVIPSDRRSVAYLASFKDVASRIGSIKL